MTAFVRARFVSGRLGLNLTIGATLLIATAIIFGYIAEDVVSAEAITVIDENLARWFHGHATPTHTRLMLFITHINGIMGVIVMACMCAFYLYREKSWHWLLTLVLAVPGGMLVNVGLKYAFHRARPSFDDPLLILTTYSFPSGHASGATLFYGVVAAYLVSLVKSALWRVLICLAALMMVALVGLSRIYLGVHYLSDVLAAVAASSAWLALVLTSVAPWENPPFRRFGKLA